jgi:hypothetical protein
MTAKQLIADIKYSLSSPRSLSNLANEHRKTLSDLDWNQDQLALFLAVLPEFELSTSEGVESQVKLIAGEANLDTVLANLLKEAKKPLPTDKLIQQLKEFNTSGPQLLAIAKQHPNMNIIGGHAILWK